MLRLFSSSGHPRTKAEYLKTFSSIIIPPTSEQIHLAGGPQTTTSASTVESGAANGDLLNRAIPSGITSLEDPSLQIVSSNLEPPFKSKSSVWRIDEMNKDKSEQLVQVPMKSDSSGHGVHGAGEATDSRIFRQQNEWITEISWTKEDIEEAERLEQEADAAYFSRMTALRTAAWVRHTNVLMPALTPLGQIQPSKTDSEIGKEDKFTGFSGLKGEREERWSGADIADDDPFEPPPDNYSLLPQRRPDLPASRPSIPSSSAIKVMTYRDRPLSPCAYRGKIQADLLFNALHHEISTNTQPDRSMNEPGLESEFLPRHSESLSLDNGRIDIVMLPETLRNSELYTVLHDFESITDGILGEVKAANERFFHHTKAFLGNKHGS